MSRTIAQEASALRTLRLRVVRVAVVLGWASVGVVVAGTVLPHAPHPNVSQAAVWALTTAAALANTVLALLPWGRLVGRPSGEAILSAWAVALVTLVAALTYAGGGWTSDYYLLYFLVIPFVAATEPRRQQAAVYGLLVTGYLLAVMLAPSQPPVGTLVVRLAMLVGGCGVATVFARALTDNAVSRARAEWEARIERVLADEAHHRIKNNLQLVADLLTLEAGKAGSGLKGVVDETLSRIQSVAAVHQWLAHRAQGTVRLLPVVERIVGLLVDRLGAGRVVTVHGDDTELPADRATWTALVVNELVTNALHHGEGTVTVDFAASDGSLHMLVGDEGRGFEETSEGLGLALIHRLIEDGMHGTVTTHNDVGEWQVRVTIPLNGQEVAHARAHR